VERPLTGIVAT